MPDPRMLLSAPSRKAKPKEEARISAFLYISTLRSEGREVFELTVLARLERRLPDFPKTLKGPRGSS